MANLCKKISPAIKRQDLFGIPVQLTYNGQVAFNTVFGGIVSILFMLALAAAFSYQLYVQITDPKFMNYPPRVDYSEKTTKLNTTTGTTLAYAVNKFYADESQVRIKFLAPDNSKIDAVYCRDLYKEQIEAEVDIDDGTDYFTQMFSDQLVDFDSAYW